MVGGKAAVEAGAVTHGAVRCSALLVNQMLFMAERSGARQVERREVVNNSAAGAKSAVENSPRFPFHRHGRDTLRPATNMQRIGVVTLITIVSSGTGRALIRNESSDEDPFEVHHNNAFVQSRPA